MVQPPSHPKLYHITNVANLSSILADGSLFADSVIVARGGPSATIGMDKIKRRRLYELPVTPYPDTKVGEYVPFYFCPRSVMLYVISKGNHPELAFRGGQREVLHLELDLHAVVRWADQTGVRWAFSLSSAAAYYAEFRNSVADLAHLNWEAIGNHNFREKAVSEAKQAEFLVNERVPWSLVERIGTQNAIVHRQTTVALQGAAHRPPVEIRADWYY